MVLGEGNGTLLQYSCLENPMDRGAWWAAVHGVAKSLARLSDFTFTFHFHALEKAMAPHSSVFAWRKLLRVLWTARRSNQSILKEINFEDSLEGLMLKRKLQFLGHLMQRVDSLEKTLMLRKIEGRKRRG